MYHQHRGVGFDNDSAEGRWQKGAVSLQNPSSYCDIGTARWAILQHRFASPVIRSAAATLRSTEGRRFQLQLEDNKLLRVSTSGKLEACKQTQTKIGGELRDLPERDPRQKKSR